MTAFTPFKHAGLWLISTTLVVWIGLSIALWPHVVLAYFVAINVSALCAFAYDKQAAKTNGARIPETLLVRCAMFGGTLGALIGAYLFKHKTRKRMFNAKIQFIFALQVSALFLLERYGNSQLESLF